MKRKNKNGAIEFALLLTFHYTLCFPLGYFLFLYGLSFIVCVASVGRRPSASFHVDKPVFGLVWFGLLLCRLLSPGHKRYSMYAAIVIAVGVTRGACRSLTSGARNPIASNR